MNPPDSWDDDDADSGSDLPSLTSEQRERVLRRLFARIDAMPPPAAPPAPPAPAAPRPTTPPPTLAAATLRSQPDGLVNASSVSPAVPSEVTPPSPPPVPLPKVVRAPPALTITAPALDLPPEVWAQRGALPFRPLPPGQVPALLLAARTQPSRVEGCEPGKTAPLSDASLAGARAVLPFVVRAADGSLVSFPRLTLQQYVSLRADLGLRPAEASATLRRYGVPSEASLRALDAHWQEKLAASAELRAEHDAATETYVRWQRGESG